MVQYLGVEVLEREPDGRVARSDSMFRELVPVGAPFGRVDQDDVQGVSGAIREYLWTAATDTDIASLRAFLMARAGRKNLVWIPSLEHDLTLVGDKLSTDTSIDVTAIGYTSHLWPGTDARRHLSIRTIAPGGTVTYRKVLTATDNGDGTESLYLDGILGQAVKAATWIVSFMRLCRLEDDITRLEFRGRGYCEARIRMRELPHEVSDVEAAYRPPTGYGYSYGLNYGGAGV